MGLIPKKDEKLFLFYQLQRLKMERFEQVTTLPFVNNEIVSGIKIPICEMSEQKRIISIFSNIDNSIQNIQDLIQETLKFKDGITQKLISKGINHVNFKKIKWYFKKEIKIPSEWNVLSLKDVSKKGLRNGIFKKPSEFGSGISLVNVVDLYSESKIDLTKLERVKVSESELDTYRVNEGDIFFDRSSLVLDGIGHCNIALDMSEPVVFECHLMRLSPNELVLPKFLFYYTKTHLFKQFIFSIAKTTTMTTISQPDLEKAKILVPSLPEQKLIVSIISRIELQLEYEKSLKANLETLKKGLVESLLTGKIRVK